MTVNLNALTTVRMTQEIRSLLDHHNNEHPNEPFIINVLVDAQNDFACNNGRLPAYRCEPVADECCKFVKMPCDLLIRTFDSHTDSYPQTVEGRNLPISHCLINTYGWQIVERIDDACHTIDTPVFDVTKNTFGSIELADFIRCLYTMAIFAGMKVEIRFAGYVTNICVISNVCLVKAVAPDARIIVYSTCCAGVTEKAHQRALEQMKDWHIEVI